MCKDAKKSKGKFVLAFKHHEIVSTTSEILRYILFAVN